jgi:hypothetical protein
MFFLQDLDMTKEIVLPEVLVKDDLRILHTLGYLNKPKPCPWEIVRLYDEDDKAAYPLGRSPSGSQLTDILYCQPWVMMRRWSWPEELNIYRDAEEGRTEHLASMLFRTFTSQVWITLNDHWKKEPDVFYWLMTLVECMEIWSLEKLHEKLPSYRVIPTNSNVHGSIPGPKSLSFSRRYTIYFVLEKDPLSKVWDVLGQAPGYISTYQKEAKKLDETELDNLHDALETLFSYCHCLPNSNREGQSTVWEVHKEEVILLGNPLYYKLDTIGGGGKARKTRRAPTHSGTVSIQTGLLQLTGLTKKQASRMLKYAETMKCAAAKSKKSNRIKNRRVPPPAKKKKKDVSDEDKPSGSEQERRLRIRPPTNQSSDGSDEDDSAEKSDVTPEDSSHYSD